jgi:uncharacterized damage-inducible protein DinB
MQLQPIDRPDVSEHDAYYSRYIDLVPEGDILAMLDAQLADTIALLSGVGEERAGLAYEAGKWTLKEVLGHMIDTERIFAYRALRIARNDPTPMEGFDQDPYVQNANFTGVRLAVLMNEFRAVRQSTLFLLRSLEPQAWNRSGIANGKAITVRALAYLTAGHELHHRAILRDRYLGS